jgi:hypothetical protein
MVTNKTRSKEPRQPASAEQVLCLDPIDSPTTKPTTPQVPLINHLRAFHSTLMVVLLSRVVTQRTGPYGEVLRKQLRPLKYHKIIIKITSSYHRYSHHVS